MGLLHRIYCTGFTALGLLSKQHRQAAAWHGRANGGHQFRAITIQARAIRSTAIRATCFEIPGVLGIPGILGVTGVRGDLWNFGSQ